MMTKKFFLSVSVMMMMCCTTMMGSERHGNGNPGIRGHEGGQRHEVVQHNGGHMVQGHDLRGYEDRVRWHGGRWQYLRDGRWYGYDRFIDPVLYFGSPLDRFLMWLR